MASMCIQIDTERDIAAQILRHRSFSFQEFSTRYAKTEHAKIPEFRRQDAKNRQSSHDDLSDDLRRTCELHTTALFADAFSLYEYMLSQDVAKETARRVLPLCTPTTMYMHGTLRSWIHYIDVRCDPGTQLEHRQIADQCKAIFCENFPIIGEACWPITEGAKS